MSGLLALWLATSAPHAAEARDGDGAARAAWVGVGLAAAGVATTGVGAQLRWGQGHTFPEQPLGLGLMAGGTVVGWVGSGLAGFSSLKAARLRGARLGWGSASLGVFTASLATQLLVFYGAPAALAGVSAGLATVQLARSGRGAVTVLPQGRRAGLRLVASW